MTRVAFLWHMHQPYYEDLVTREHILPWVRLHALKDYYGMVALLEDFPRVRATFNLVPSLLVQLEAFAEDRAYDRYLDLGMKPADTLSSEDINFILANFFHAQRARMIEIYPRYAELRAKRGSGASATELATAARRFSTADLRDLQVWQKLAWIDPIYLDRDARIRALISKGQGFSEEDKSILRSVERELLAAVIPAYRRLASTGQIEIATSPFYHPILPLLCDTDIYKHTHPHSRLPRHRFVHPEDAREQLERARLYHQRLFGQRPVGLWPSEGSVSDEVIELAAAAGFQWLATDELILARTLGTAFARDAYGYVDNPQRLYAAYEVQARGRQIGCGFRDHALSDLIGFTYSGWGAEQAAEDFVVKLAESGRRAEASGRHEPVIFVILDGENAWEHFEGGGRPFLRALYRRLSDHPTLRTVTMAEACAHPTERLSGVFPGSWIDANFYIWIGHQDDQRAWSQLAEARQAITSSAGSAEPTAVARAWEELFIAEGSDWFWWYGDDHSSDHDAEFDDLFRRHLRNVYRLLSRPVPDELFLSNISAGVPTSLQIDPTRLLNPIIDGEDTSYFEWLGAGAVEIRDVAGAMHQATRQSSILSRIRFGFDRVSLFVRVDGQRPMRDILQSGKRIGIAFLQADGEGRRYWVRQTPDGAIAAFEAERGLGQVRVASGRLLEIAIPLAELGLIPGDRVSFVLVVHDEAGGELERHPAGHPIEVQVPDDSFDAINWSA